MYMLQIILCCIPVTMYMCTHAGALPPNWDPMPTDERCRAVVLPPHSDEHKIVSGKLALIIKRVQIVRIRRIQNKTLYLQYMGRKQAMDRHNLPHGANELKLWHGCTEAVMKQINHSGFNTSYTATKGKFVRWTGSICIDCCVLIILLMYMCQLHK